MNFQKNQHFTPAWRSFSEHLKNLGTSSHKELPLPLSKPGRLFNRELSWLEFNDRVLGEAANPTVPPLERLRFAAIVSSNLDEFFMVRVADVVRRAKQQRTHSHLANFSAQRLLTQIRDHVLRQKSQQAQVVRDLLQVLSNEGIRIYSEFPPDPELDQEIRERLPDLKFIIRRNSEPLPPLTSERIHVFVRFVNSNAIIAIEERSARLLSLNPAGTTLRYALLERWLAARASSLFPGQEVIEAFPFKIIRDADLRYRPDDDDSIEEQIIEAVQGRGRARVVRLEVDAPHYSEGALFLASSLRLDSAMLYRFDLPLDLRTLARLYTLDAYQTLKYPPITPQIPPIIEGRNIFDVIRARDVLLHHPYDSFDVIVEFLKSAARDPQVTHITHTMYRTSKESPIMEALKEGVRRGKKVTAYIEIKARFDELNNVRWAKELRQAGVKVIRPLAGYKVHCKMTQVVRHEDGQDVSYLHLGTGNYHPGTAKQYTDLGLLTCNPELGKEIKYYFQGMTARQTKMNFNVIMAAPGNLHHGFVKLIKAETEIQRNGGKGHIIAKMNSLVDPNIIEALYEASQAGVKIELLVRGICCLRPGIKGMSDNIKVVSVVDRFLEHSRVFYFRADGAKKIYLSSADWMPRNFYARYEVAFPIKDAILKKYIREVILANSLADNDRAWLLLPDGQYKRVTPSSSGKTVRSQFLFEDLARNRYKGTILQGRS
ncbi:MAG: Polyphosphate kinase [Elusimicrobia bacterium]|nr:Polyphosphate kinase [Elusimicrobiota bacterium]